MAELTYTKNGDYLIPDLAVDGADEAGEMPLGRYGLLRQSFLQKNHPGTYASMLLTGRLMPHLRRIDEQAQSQADRMVSELMEQKGVDEALKERDQMAWLGAVNGFTAQAEETVLREIVYV